MMKRVITIASVMMIFGAMGCNTAKSICDRADECNALTLSVDECTDNINLCYDGLTGSQQDDWDSIANDCLDFSGCDLFLSCYNTMLPYC